MKNNNSTPINGWTLSWALPNNQSITAMWNGTYTQNKSNINVTSDSSHSYIAANGGTQTLVYNINYSGSNTQPRNFTLRTANSASNVSAQDITYEVSPDWGSGATIHLTIKNNSSTPINGWKLSWTLPNNQSITDMWNGTYTKSGSTINVTSDNYHNYIAANGGTQTLVYNINYIGSNTKPTNFMLNGTPCLVK
ncbi:cellulose-binding domain-containing protein [Clostridium sp. SHJSY1]|nr:cellulose-binding domain-containing protein [Clostridium sp. SHJSY1]